MVNSNTRFDLALGCLINDIKLSDCHITNSGPAYMLGIQALVQLLIEQARLDRGAGINSRGLVGGYPGSLLGGLASLSWLRESWIDPFGFSSDKKAARAHRDFIINWITDLGNMAKPSLQTDIESDLDLML